MPGFTFRHVDPRPEDFQAALEEIIRHGLRDLARRGITLPSQYDHPNLEPLLDAWEQPEGVRVLHWTVSWRHPPGVVIGAAWWTDAIGRRHWYLEEALSDEDSSFHRHSPGDSGRDLTVTFSFGEAHPRHPLEWFLPEPSCAWRERRGKREFIVVCGCGVAGTPAEIAWTGSCCGPCFDQRQDGFDVPDVPPARSAIGEIHAFALAADGKLITLVAPENGFTGTVVKAWRSPWTDSAPLWSVRMPQTMERAPVCGGRVVTLFDGQGYLVQLDADTGQTLQTHQEEDFRGLYSLSFVPRVGMLAGVRFLWSDEGELCVWDCSADSAISRVRHREAAGFSALAVQQGGIRAVLDNRHPFIEVREVISGRLIEKLRLPASAHAMSLVVGPDSLVLASARRSSPPNESLLACWPAAPPFGSGRSAWLSRTPERLPAITKRLDGDVRFLTLSPDGRTAVGVLGAGLMFWEAPSLVERGRLFPPLQVTGPLAFTPDGRSLLVLTNRGLAVWPWLEMLGKREPVGRAEAALSAP
jgi:hypothetical protein